MTDEDFRGLGVRYLAEIERLAPDSIRITDKAPGNFMFAGLIHLALPNAQIIHTVRDPVDTCLSYFSKLLNEGQNQHLRFGRTWPVLSPLSSTDGALAPCIAAWSHSRCPLL